MDIISHVLLGAAVVADKKLLWPSLIFSVAPDLINAIPVHLYMTYKFRRQGKSYAEIFHIFTRPENWKKAPGWTHTSYLYVHSFLFAALVGLAVYFIYPPWIILMRAWILHLLIDMFTHKEWFSIKPFYPFSEWHLNFFNWFETTLTFFGIAISIAIFALVYLI